MGAGLAQSGLGRRTAWGTLTLLIGANLPDVDVVSHWDGPLGDLAFRRGWTHGIPALLVWPFVLTGTILLLDRFARRFLHIVPALNPREVLRLSAIAITSHPILDTLNTYGVRWLMPFDGRWFYGDTLFIVDPWMWLLLGLGLGFSRGGRHRAARLGLVGPHGAGKSNWLLCVMSSGRSWTAKAMKSLSSNRRFQKARRSSSLSKRHK